MGSINIPPALHKMKSAAIAMMLVFRSKPWEVKTKRWHEGSSSSEPSPVEERCVVQQWKSLMMVVVEYGAGVESG